MFLSYPHKFGTYTVEGPVHQGRIGTVYRASDYVTDQGTHHVALKILHATVQDQRREQVVNTFLRDADALSRLRHPQLCRVLDFGAHQGIPYLVMEWIDSPNLSSRIIPSEPWEVTSALQTIRQLTLPLGELHGAGLVHRDLKPENILLAPERGLVVVDLGTASTKPPPVGSDHISHSGNIQLYLSPEQVHGAALTPASDVFALGVLLYQLLSGRMPFEGGSLDEVLHQIQNLSPMPPSCWNRKVPPVVDAFLWRVLAKEPAERVSDMESFRNGLDVCLKQVEQLGQAPTSAVSLADFATQLERSLAGAPRAAKDSPRFTAEGGIVSAPPTASMDLYATVAPITQPTPPVPQREPHWLRERRQLQKRSELLVQQLQTQERQHRQLRDEQERQRRQAELDQATPEQLRDWCLLYPGERLVRKAYLARRTPDQVILDQGAVGRPARTRRSLQGLLLGGLLGVVLGGLIGVAVSASGAWGWAGGAAVGGMGLGFFGGLGNGPKGAASAGAFGTGLGAAGGLASSLPFLLILLIISGSLALLFGLIGSILSGCTAAKDWAELGPLPPSAYRLSLENARQLYLEG